MSTQQTERDLLCLAAKAAGIKLVFDPDGLPRNCTDRPPAMNIFTARLWNPLEDDGDALKLSVMLGLDVKVSNGFISVAKDAWIGFAEVEGDPYAATRRAITLTAAEIGKAMP